MLLEKSLKRLSVYDTNVYSYLSDPCAFDCSGSIDRVQSVSVVGICRALCSSEIGLEKVYLMGLLFHMLRNLDCDLEVLLLELLVELDRESDAVAEIIGIHVLNDIAPILVEHLVLFERQDDAAVLQEFELPLLAGFAAHRRVFVGSVATVVAERFVVLPAVPGCVVSFDREGLEEKR